MNSIILLIISMAVCLLYSILKKVLIDQYADGIRSHYYNSAVLSGVAAIGLLIASDSLKCSLFSVLLGILFGAVTFGQQVMSLKAMERGPLCYTSVLISLSTLITALSGAIFWDETISEIQIVGIVLMLGCLVLSVDFKSAEKKASFQWFGYCLAAFLCSGSIGILQKIHQKSPHKEELDSFLVIAFGVIALAATVLVLLTKKTKSTGKKSIYTLLPTLILIISGVCVAANNKLNLYLSGVIDSAIFFPLVNGGGLMLTILAALILFRERPTLQQWGGILLGIVSIVFLCNPF